MTERFDWPALMTAGIRGLRLRPAEFWAMTPADLAFLLGHGDGKSPLDRNGLESLIRRFPDKAGNQNDK
ncbi:rcc01693 family protein [uncultured Jannaschia sp.]|uniref:rcc01693 family protein n=2 Tax=uncultured Jannaschia sp. TaxID=293347 RepID=UPI002637449A|nr:rcc01693 family protein [uncultured Jannaschia sp.]